MTDPADADRALVEACVRGEAGAWEELARRLLPSVALRIARVYRSRLGRPPRHEEAEEISQETFATLARGQARALRSFQWRASLSTYVSTVAASRAVDRIRRDCREEESRRVLRHLAERLEPSPGASRPEQGILDAELAARALAALEGLSPRDRLVVRMYFWEGSHPAHIARTMGTSPDYIWVILKRALARIRKDLSEAEPPGAG